MLMIQNIRIIAMTIQINKDKLISYKEKMGDLWFIILENMIKKTNNNLFVVSGNSKFYNVSSNKYNPIILKVPKILTIISQIPHTEYSQKSSQQKKFQNVLIDFRFELLFQNDKQKYKKFYLAYMFGDGVYAPFQNHYIHITRNSLKRQNPPRNSDLILPKDWLKFVKIVKQN